jgi:hypothetical protein
MVWPRGGRDARDHASRSSPRRKNVVVGATKAQDWNALYAMCDTSYRALVSKDQWLTEEPAAISAWLAGDTLSDVVASDISAPNGDAGYWTATFTPTLVADGPAGHLAHASQVARLPRRAATFAPRHDRGPIGAAGRKAARPGWDLTGDSGHSGPRSQARIGRPSADAGVVLQIALDWCPIRDGNGGLGRDSHESLDRLGNDLVVAWRKSQEVGAVGVADGSADLLAGRIQCEDCRSRDRANAGALSCLFDGAGGPGPHNAANSSGKQGRGRRARRRTGTRVACRREGHDEGSEGDKGDHASPAGHP